jgi:hypothetical protein
MLHFTFLVILLWKFKENMLNVFSNKKFIIEENCKKERSKKYLHLRNEILRSDFLFELLQVTNILLPNLAQLCVHKSTRRSTNIGVLSVRTSVKNCHKFPVRS